MALYHFSENPGITVFRPQLSKTSALLDEALVWAIDDWHSPMYCVPRDCPRACFWAGPKTTREDRERWLNHLEPRFVMVVEASWLERIRSVQLYRYTMPEASFSHAGHEGGHYVSREVVCPIALQPMGSSVRVSSCASHLAWGPCGSRSSRLRPSPIRARACAMRSAILRTSVSRDAEWASAGGLRGGAVPSPIPVRAWLRGGALASPGRAGRQ